MHMHMHTHMHTLLPPAATGALVALGGTARLPSSAYAAWQEAVLQRGPFVSRRACREAAEAHGRLDWAYGTSSQARALRAHCEPTV